MAVRDRNTPDNKMKKRTKVLDTKEAEGPEVGPLLERERWEGLAARIMNLGPYELATLAARICPELCLKNPVEAIGKARHLLMAVIIQDMKADADLVTAMKDRENKNLATRRVDFQVGVKRITGVKKSGKGRYSASYWFERFLKWKDGRKWKAWLKSCRRDGFTELEVAKFQEEFDDFRRPHKKGRQGRRISDDDGRPGIRPGGKIAETIPELGAGLRLVPRKDSTRIAQNLNLSAVEKDSLDLADTRAQLTNELKKCDPTTADAILRHVDKLVHIAARKKKSGSST